MDQLHWIDHMVKVLKLVHVYYLLMLLLTVSAVVGLCASASQFMKIKKKKMKKQNLYLVHQETESGWGAVKRVLVGSVQWTGVKWVRVRDEEDPVVVGHGCFVESVSGDQDVRYVQEMEEEESPASPLWQRRILMGERCELPRFSGLILYDEQGQLVQYASDRKMVHCDYEQEKTHGVTLQDLM